MSINAIRFAQYGLKLGRSNFNAQAAAATAKRAQQVKVTPNQAQNIQAAAPKATLPAQAANGINTAATKVPSVVTLPPIASPGFLAPAPTVDTAQPEKVKSPLPPVSIDTTEVKPLNPNQIALLNRNSGEGAKKEIKPMPMELPPISAPAPEEVIDRIGPTQTQATNSIKSFIASDRGYDVLPGGLYVSTGYLAPIDIKA